MLRNRFFGVVFTGGEAIFETMKQSVRIAMWVAIGLLVIPIVSKDAQGNPYQGIVERNVFALKPAPDPDTLKPAAPEPPKITPMGLMSGFGPKRALFKTAMPASKPGAPPQETSMMLSVGQREGEIELVAIDEAAGTITFNNHGQIQTLDLEKDGMKPPSGPAPAPFPGISAPGGQPGKPNVPAPPTAFNPPRGGNPGVSMTTIGRSGSTLRNIPTRSLRLPTAAGASASAPVFGGGATTVTTPTIQSGQSSGLSSEEQAAIMIVDKAANPSLPPPPVPGMSQ